MKKKRVLKMEHPEGAKPRRVLYDSLYNSLEQAVRPCATARTHSKYYYVEPVPEKELSAVIQTGLKWERKKTVERRLNELRKRRADLEQTISQLVAELDTLTLELSKGDSTS